MPKSDTKDSTDAKPVKSPGTSFTVRVTDKQHQALEALAGLEKISLAELMRQLIQDGISRGLNPDRVAKKLQEQQKEFQDLQQALIRD